MASDIYSKNLRQWEFVFPDATGADVIRIVSIPGLVQADVARANVGGCNMLVGVITLKEPVTREVALDLVGHEAQMNHVNGALNAFKERVTGCRNIEFVNLAN